MRNEERVLRWEHFPHDADMGVRGFGQDTGEAFAAAALALTAILCDPAGIAPLKRIDIRCEAPDIELLLADWLNALIYEMAVRSMVFSRFEVRLDGNALSASAWGEPMDRARHQPAAEVKGATYTELRVFRRLDGDWVAQCVVDV